MSNWFTRAAAAIGRLGRGGRRALPVTHAPAETRYPATLIEPVGVVEGQSNAFEAHAALSATPAPAADDLTALLSSDSALERAMTEALSGTPTNSAQPETPWGDVPIADALADSELAVARGLAVEAMTDAIASSAPRDQAGPTGAMAGECDAVPAVPAIATIPMAEVPVAPEASGERATDTEPVLERVQLVRPAAELKPEPVAPAAPVIEPKPERSKPTITFAQLYDLISTEVGRRADETAGVYERLLRQSRDELSRTRRTTRLAWSVGGVMTAVAAVGALWTATETRGTKAAVAGIKSQVATGAQAAAERDAMRIELHRAQETGRVEATALKARLDQALLVSAERDRLRGQLDAARQAQAAAEDELKLARANLVATTQPLSSARPTGSVRGTLLGDAVGAPAEKVAKAPEKDRWSTLLNGGQD